MKSQFFENQKTCLSIERKSKSHISIGFDSIHNSFAPSHFDNTIEFDNRILRYLHNQVEYMLIFNTFFYFLHMNFCTWEKKVLWFHCLYIIFKQLRTNKSYLINWILWNGNIVYSKKKNTSTSQPPQIFYETCLELNKVHESETNESTQNKHVNKLILIFLYCVFDVICAHSWIHLSR